MWPSAQVEPTHTSGGYLVKLDKLLWRGIGAIGLTTSLAVMPACQGDDGSQEGDGDGETAGDGDGDGDGDDGTDDGDDTFTPPPGGIRRLLVYQYTNSIEYMFGPEAAAAANPPADVPLHGYASIGATQLSPSSPTVERYELSSLAIADAAIADLATFASHVPCVQDSPDDACYQEVAETIGHMAWRRPLTDAEIDSAVETATEARAWGDGDFYAGLKYELVRLLLSPHFLYVKETGVQDGGEPSQYWLTQPELVTRMSLLLLGRTPSLELLEAAENGDYEGADAVEQLTRNMLADPSAPDAISEFFAEYLDLYEISAKDTEMFPKYSEALVESMQMETELLLREIIWEENSDWHTFLSSNTTYVDGALADLYGMAASPTTWQKAVLPEEQKRVGFLGQASFLARNAHGDGNSPTRRGQYIQERFLCFSVPPPPPEVIPDLPEPPDGPITLRELLETIHLNDEGCAACHAYMDPYGFTFEGFNALGAWRTEDNGLPIDTAVVDGTFGPLADASELAAKLAADPRIGRCLVDNMIRFGRGSLEDPANEAQQMLALYDEFGAAEFRVQEMLVSFVMSPMFRHVGEAK